MTRELEERLAECWRRCEPVGATSQAIDTRLLLKALGEATALGPMEAESLEALCRKVHVAGRVCTGYSAGWKRSGSSAPIPPSLWPILILVLLRASAMAGDGPPDEWHTGMSWKCLNAAFAAIDLALEEGVDIDELRVTAEGLLQVRAR